MIPCIIHKGNWSHHARPLLLPDLLARLQWQELPARVTSACKNILFLVETPSLGFPHLVLVSTQTI